MSKPKSRKPISEQTKTQILDAAWDLIAAEGRPDVGLAEIGSKANVSRQTVFYAFGNRAEVLVAMVRHKDSRTEHVARMSAAMGVEKPDADAVVIAVEAWLDYLPEIYPVGILLDAASLTDADAAAAWNDRMAGALLAGFRHMCGRLKLRGAASPEQLAEEIWAQVHPTMWRRLVIECGWSAEAFRESRIRLIRGIMDAVVA